MVNLHSRCTMIWITWVWSSKTLLIISKIAISIWTKILVGRTQAIRKTHSIHIRAVNRKDKAKRNLRRRTVVGFLRQELRFINPISTIEALEKTVTLRATIKMTTQKMLLKHFPTKDQSQEESTQKTAGEASTPRLKIPDKLISQSSTNQMQTPTETSRSRSSTQTKSLSHL